MNKIPGNQIIGMLDDALLTYELNMGRSPKLVDCDPHFETSPLRKWACLIGQTKGTISESMTEKLFTNAGHNLAPNRGKKSGDGILVDIPGGVIGSYEVKSCTANSNGRVIPIQHFNPEHSFNFMVSWVFEPNRVRVFKIPKSVLDENVTEIQYADQTDRWVTSCKTSELPKWMRVYKIADITVW